MFAIGARLSEVGPGIKKPREHRGFGETGSRVPSRRRQFSQKLK